MRFYWNWVVLPDTRAPPSPAPSPEKPGEGENPKNDTGVGYAHPGIIFRIYSLTEAQ